MTENMATIMTLLDQERNTQAALGIIVLSPIVFVVELFLKPSTYGKLHESKRSFLGPLVSARFAWMFFESPNWMWALLGYWNRNQNPHVFPLPNMILLLAFFLHYINRSIVYPFRMSSSSQMPIAVFFIAGAYCVVNGYIQTQALCFFQFYPDGYETSPRFLLGMLLMIFGFYLGYSSDATLLKLKQQNKGYQIPYGGMFEYVSAPHFLGEILEWTGFAIAANTMTAYSFPIWTSANLIPRAILQHQWYRTTFREYPRNRKAILPFAS